MEEELTEVALIKWLLEISKIKEAQNNKKLIVYQIDRKDGILKDYTKTLQYQEKIQELVNKTICKRK